jgi:TolB-like protein/DNA-binding winged helix-turn-helix (wHTH) protein/Flp pilus assembly protein TadD
VARFGVFELDLRSGELRKHGVRVRLADQPFQVLRLLIDRPGELVSRDELRNALWQADTFVDFDTGLSSAVRKLRDTLGDSADNPQFIETIPKRGYRFIAPVRGTEPEPTAAPEAVAAKARPPRIEALVIGGIVVLAASIVGATLYQRGALRSAAAAGRITSIAVLPFDNLTGDDANRYLVDGMTDGLTTNLAQIEGLQVISRASAMRYRDTKKPLPEIARELTVDGLVLGAVVKSGDRLRVSAQLVQGATDRHVWAHSYESELKDAVTLQNEIAGAIARATNTNVKSAGSRRVAALREVNPDAYLLYLRGISALNRGSYEGLRSAETYLQQAVAQQPDFAIGWAALAQARLQYLYAGPLSPRETVPQAETAARKALELDDESVVAHRVLGQVLHIYYWKFPEADREMERARGLDPNSVEAHTAAAAAFIRNGKIDEGIAESERARRLDPLSLNASMNVAAAFRSAGQYDRAIAGFKNALAIEPRVPRIHFQLGITYAFMGKWNDAVPEIETACSLAPDNSRFDAYRAYVYATIGRQAEAKKILGELESRAKRQYVSSYGLALIHDALGEKEAAVAALQKAYEDHAVEFSQSAQYPPFQSMRGDPRVDVILQQTSRHR